MLNNTLVAALVLGVVGCFSQDARAQEFSALGTRSAALGAFVAVADDVSAVVWNPAGLATGPFFNLSLDLGRSTERPGEGPGDGPGARNSATLVGLSTLPLGLAYYRLSHTTVSPAASAGPGSLGRQEGHVFVRTLVTTNVGATVVQSVGEVLTLGATLRLVRGGVRSATGPAAAWEDAFALADASESESSTRGDLDLGAMVSLGTVRAGVVMRNVTRPTFGAPERAEVTLERHTRVGLAWGEGWPGISRTIVAVDADLTDVSHPDGERRDVAAGVERWFARQRLGLRAGVRASTVGDARTMLTVGGSYALVPGIYVDGYVGRGDRNRTAWGVGARVTY